MNLTAKEQYELVKDHPEVFENVMFYQPPASDGLGCWRGTSSNWFIRDEIAELTLTALFMLAAECGVRNVGGSLIAYEWSPDDSDGDEPDMLAWVVGTGDTPLAAAVAAYKRRSGT